MGAGKGSRAGGSAHTTRVQLSPIIVASVRRCRRPGNTASPTVADARPSSGDDERVAGERDKVRGSATAAEHCGRCRSECTRVRRVAGSADQERSSLATVVRDRAHSRHRIPARTRCAERDDGCRTASCPSAQALGRPAAGLASTATRSRTSTVAGAVASSAPWRLAATARTTRSTGTAATAATCVTMVVLVRGRRSRPPSGSNGPLLLTKRADVVVSPPRRP
jgi:hypothetical protein